MWGRELFIIKDNFLFEKFDTITFSAVDTVVLRPLPSYAKPGTSQITGFVTITNNGVDIPEVMSGDIGAVSSAGSFSYNANNVITLAFTKGQFASVQEAMDAVSNYHILFQLANGTSYLPGQYFVEFYDLGTQNKFYDSVVLNMSQLHNLIDTNIQAANLNPWGMNPFEVRIRGVLRS